MDILKSIKSIKSEKILNLNIKSDNKIDSKYILRKIEFMDGSEISDETIDRGSIVLEFNGNEIEIIPDIYWEEDKNLIKERCMKEIDMIMKNTIEQVNESVTHYRNKNENLTKEDEKWKLF
mgnify:CR=1 FL=1